MKYKVKANVVSTQMQNEIVLMDVQRGVYFSLNETGAFLWDKLSGEGADINELCHSLQDAFEVDPEVCRQDISQLLSQMNESGILEEIS